ncbi:MAG: outer membrane beta-barrel protein [Bacteroidia bacterium]|jgi:hypothetical protein
MIKTNSILSFLLLLSGILGAQQTVRGRVSSAADNQPVAGAIAQILRSDSTLYKASTSNQEGLFQFEDVADGSYLLKVSMLGFVPQWKSITVTGEPFRAGMFRLEASTKELAEQQVEATQIRTEQKGDTTQFNAGAFKTNPDATLEDLVKKMPGMVVENGQVKVGGEQVQKITIDGKEFFGDDAAMALKNLPAEVVDKIQVFDRLSDQAQFTGFDDGNSRKGMNVITRGGMKNAEFGKFYGGYGTEERYNAGVNYNKFNGNRKFTVLGQSNNINVQNFSSQDLVGLTGGGGGMGGMGGGRMGGGAGGGGMMRMMGMVPGASDPSNFMVGQSAGINTTHSLGLNYADSLAPKWKINGSYFFNNGYNSTERTLSRQFFGQDKASRVYDESNEAWANNINHRANLRLEYTIDTSNSFIYTPRFSWQGNQNGSIIDGQTLTPTDTLLGRTQTASSGQNLPYSINNNLLYRHKFKKAGRTVSIAVNADITERIGLSDLRTENSFAGAASDSSLRFLQESDQYTQTQSYSANIMYTEPMGKALQLFLNYAPSVTLNGSDRKTLRGDSLSNIPSVLDTLLSSNFQTMQTIQRGGAGIRLRSPRLMGVINVNAQQFTLQNESFFPTIAPIQRSFLNVLPFVMLNYKFSSATNIRLFYRSNTNAPTVLQLQEVLDNSNPLQLSTGNASLKQEFAQTLTLRFGTAGKESGRALFFNGSAGLTNNYIGNSVIIPLQDTIVLNGLNLRRGAQLSRPANLNGFRSLRGLLTLSTPLKWMKSTLNLQAGLNYTLTPGLINNIENKTASSGYTAGVVVASNISEKIDFTLIYNGGWNIIENTIQPMANTQYQIHSGGARINWMPFPWLVLNTDAMVNQYTGLGEGFDQQFVLWNAYIGYKFLDKKAAELKISAFDILNQNNSISRTVTETFVEDNVTRVLNRYFMITFTYTLRKFKSADGSVIEPREGRKKNKNRDW